VAANTQIHTHTNKHLSRAYTNIYCVGYKNCIFIDSVFFAQAKPANTATLASHDRGSDSGAGSAATAVLHAEVDLMRMKLKELKRERERGECEMCLMATKKF